MEIDRYRMESERHDGCGRFTGYVDEIQDPAGEWVKFEVAAEMQRLIVEYVQIIGEENGVDFIKEMAPEDANKLRDILGEQQCDREE